MANHYTDEKNALIILALLKKNGIRKVIASPGATNVTLVASMQSDPYFEMYSSVDERSAAYMACGLAAECGEPVVISCTGATASRNYLPGLTEAYYRKLPVLAITSTQFIGRVGHDIPQVIDRSSIQKDVAKLSVNLPLVKDEDDLWECEVKVNNAIQELFRRGGGPVHINLPTMYSQNYKTKNLPDVKIIKRIESEDEFPTLPDGRIAVFVGSHINWTDKQTRALDIFCAANNAVVFCDHTSSYKGKYRVLYSLAASQLNSNIAASRPDLLIYIGDISGDYSAYNLIGKEVWRVSMDGEIKDTFRRLTYVFEMSEHRFFSHYSDNKNANSETFLQFCQEELDRIYHNIPELPFSNVWLASQLAHRIPDNSVIHFGILNSLRTWNFFEVPISVSSASNVGGFGIDGCVSSLIGASLANENKLYFGVVGDLAYFYDMNSIGNRHIGNNLRILLVNNGKGTEFRQFNHTAAHLGDEADTHIAAAGHFGNKSKLLVKDFSTNLGFEYFSASDKESFNNVYEKFVSPQHQDRPILFEVFTTSEDESNALELIMNIDQNVKAKMTNAAKQIVGVKGVKAIKKVLGK